MIKKKRLSLIALMSLVMASIFTFTVYAATWTSTDRNGQWSNGGYTLYNNVWVKTGYGPQTIWANSYSNWGVWSQQPNTNGVKSFPNSSEYVGRTINSLASCTSSFNVTPPGSGVYESTYDIWTSDWNDEVMLWMNTNGNPNPISYNYTANGIAIPVYTNLSVGGHTWNVYRGANGTKPVYSFIRTSNTNSGTVDIKAILSWLNNQGWLSNTKTLGDVQFGFEITQSTVGNAGLNFTCNSYSVSYN
jgi:hypothetical protein